MFISKIKSRLRTMHSFRLRLGLIIFLSMILIAILEPYINNYRLGGESPISPGTYEKYLPPSYEHPLGTDLWGRDLLALTIMGLKYSLLIGIFSGAFATLLAFSIALATGWFRGLVDNALNYITNAFLVIPMFPIVAVLAASMRTGLFELCLLIIFFSWPWATRTIRAQILSLREQPYIDMAKVTNLRGIEIMFEEILPNVFPYMISTFAMSVIGAMMGETGLRMIGIGPPTIPSVGYLLERALAYGAIAHRQYNVVFPPVFLLILVFVSLNLINVGLDEVFNPRLRKITGE